MNIESVMITYHVTLTQRQYSRVLKVAELEIKTNSFLHKLAGKIGLNQSSNARIQLPSATSVSLV